MMFRGEKGSFAIEATILFPIVLFLSIGMVIACLVVYQKAVLDHEAYVLANRAAYVWDNSHKNPVSGAFDLAQSDGLYWRVTGDNLYAMLGIASMFGIESKPVTISINDNDAAQFNQVHMEDELIVKKLKRILVNKSPGLMAEAVYTNKLLERKIEVTLGKILFGFVKIQSHAVAYIDEPAEFMRTIDLARTYIDMKPGANNVHYKEPDKQNVRIHSHKDASQYLRRLVNGHTVVHYTSLGNRTIDALDRQGIAHQAFYTFRETQIRGQAEKDVELVARGEVLGVVWHFFNTGDASQVGPGTELRREMERKGIIVVVHE